jgi:moderate conductance mechanosensitive channel
MSSFLANLPDFTALNLFHFILIFGVAFLLNRILRGAANKIVQPAATSARSAQAREQQTQQLADVFYKWGSRAIWAVAILMAAQDMGINTLPIVILAGLALVGFGIAAAPLIRDAISGFYIVTEDQFAVGDTIQFGDIQGRVEQINMRRTVIRDSRGALVSVGNAELRAVGNLSRDWSQSFVDVAVSPSVPQDVAFRALDAAASELRADAGWSQALVDGPRILGLQSYDQQSSTIRLQVRTAPARQEDVARELRRRIQLEFQRQGIPLSQVSRVELVGSAVPAEKSQPASAP